MTRQLDLWGNPRVRWITPNAESGGYAVRLPKRLGGATHYFGSAIAPTKDHAYKLALAFTRKYVRSQFDLRPECDASYSTRRPRDDCYMLSGVSTFFLAARQTKQIKAQVKVATGWRQIQSTLTGEASDEAVILKIIRARLLFAKSSHTYLSRLSDKQWTRIALWHLDWFPTIPRRGAPPIPEGLKIMLNGQALVATFKCKTRRWKHDGSRPDQIEAALLSVLWAEKHGAILKKAPRRAAKSAGLLASAKTKRSFA